jgi:L-threonylcarbamoyladenylate synthase
LAGDLVVFPTETVYGIAARPDEVGATKLFEAKRRPIGLTLPVLAPTTDAAWTVGVTSPAAERLAAEFWPGPLTIVLSRTDLSKPWYLGDQADTVGVRVPDYPIALQLLERTGPIAATSANLSGRPPLSGRDELVGAFGDAVAVYLVLPEGHSPAEGQASTVVDLTGATPKVLREGPIDRSRIEAVAGRSATSR